MASAGVADKDCMVMQSELSPPALQPTFDRCAVNANEAADHLAKMDQLETLNRETSVNIKQCTLHVPSAPNEEGNCCNQPTRASAVWLCILCAKSVPRDIRKLYS